MTADEVTAAGAAKGGFGGKIGRVMEGEIGLRSRRKGLGSDNDAEKDSLRGDEHAPELKRRLKSRHLQMIAIGEWCGMQLSVHDFLRPQLTYGR